MHTTCRTELQLECGTNLIELRLRLLSHNCVKIRVHYKYFIIPQIHLIIVKSTPRIDIYSILRPCDLDLVSRLYLNMASRIESSVQIRNYGFEDSNPEFSHSKVIDISWYISFYNKNGPKIIGAKLYSEPFLIPGFGLRTHVFFLKLNLNGYAAIGMEGLPISYSGKIKVFTYGSKREHLFTNYMDSTKNFVITQFAKTILLLKEDVKSVTILFEIEEPKNLDEYKLPNIDTYKFQTLDRLETLLDNQEFSDVKFVVNNKTIHANKLILVSGSTVFSAMFKHNMKEAREDVIYIMDIQYEVLMETLRFIYAGKVIDIEKYENELLVAANKYDLEGLTEMCTIHMHKKMSVDNVIKYLHLADLYNVEQLRKEAIKFIIKNGQKILEGPDFKSLSRLHGDVVLEIVRSALSQERI